VLVPLDDVDDVPAPVDDEVDDDAAFGDGAVGCEEVLLALFGLGAAVDPPLVVGVVVDDTGLGTPAEDDPEVVLDASDGLAIGPDDDVEDDEEEEVVEEEAALGVDVVTDPVVLEPLVEPATEGLGPGFGPDVDEDDDVDVPVVPAAAGDGTAPDPALETDGEAGVQAPALSTMLMLPSIGGWLKQQ